MNDQPIENKVAKSGLVVLEMDDIVPDSEPIAFDLKDRLWEGMALKEKDFREFIQTHQWDQYTDKPVAVFCSAEAIIPNWAYMLLASKLGAVTEKLYFLSPTEAKNRMIEEAINVLDIEAYRDARVIIKGCGKKSAFYGAYGIIAQKLVPVVKSLMFGEPCSTVPVYKKPKTQ